jgi:transposase
MEKLYYSEELVRSAEFLIHTTKNVLAFKMSQNYFMIHKLNMSVKATAAALNISTNTVMQYQKKFAEAVEKDFNIRKPTPCRHFAYITLEEENDFIESLKEDAKRGLIGTQVEIRQRYIERFGKEITISGISKMLKRHNWRKIVPRSSNPKANKKEQEDYKKTCRINHGKTEGECRKQACPDNVSG